jgi:hypothetical protein
MGPSAHSIQSAIDFYTDGEVRAAARDSRDSQRDAVFRLMIPLLTALPNALLTAFMSAAGESAL